MRQMPEIQAERYRLLARLDHESQRIKEEIESIKAPFEPLRLVGSVMKKAAESVDENKFAAVATQVALAALPNSLSRHRITAVALRIATPFVRSQVHNIGRWLQKKTDWISWEGVEETLQDTAKEVRKVFRGK